MYEARTNSHKISLSKVDKQLKKSNETVFLGLCNISNTTYPVNNKNYGLCSPVVAILSPINSTLPVDLFSPNDNTPLDNLCKQTSDTADGGLTKRDQEVRYSVNKMSCE